MEIPVLSRISGFEAEIIRLQNPSLISRLLHLPAIHAYSVLTWGALILAFFAAFSSLITRTKLIIFRFRKQKLSNSSQRFVQTVSEAETSDDDCDEDEDTCSTASSDDQEEDYISTSSSDEDFRVAGNSKLRESFSWTDLVNGKSVVKSWDGLGLGLGLGSGNLLSLWDLSKNDITSSFSVPFPAMSMPSPAVMVSAGFANGKNAALRIWDTRTGCQFPETFAEWQPRRRFNSGEIYGSDDGGNLLVRDLRKVGTPMENLTECDVKTWWDSDAVMLDGCNVDDGLPWNGCGSVVSRCRNAVLSCFSLDKVGNYN